MTIEQRLAELKIVLPHAAAPAANYVPTVLHGGLLHISGQIPFDTEGQLIRGRIGDTMTVCSLVLHSGFVVIGQSACIDPAKYDEAVGCEMARKNAVNQLWALEGYHVKETDYAAQAAMEA